MREYPLYDVLCARELDQPKHGKVNPQQAKFTETVDKLKDALKNRQEPYITRYAQELLDIMEL